MGPGATDQSSDLSNIFQENSRTANTRIQQAGAQALLCHGDSTCIAFSAGHQFTLDRHFNGDGKYLLTRVEHAARLPAGYRSGEDAEGLEYLNSFTCTPWDLPYRTARRTARPTINGAQTAVVVGPQGQQTFCDKYGRIKVQFHWDRQGQLNAQSSCWLRVGQLWAGNRWGGFFWPRIGQEVIVEFLEGDPDRPLVVGCVYNAQNMPPFEMPMNALINGIKSCTHTGDAGSNFNGVVFYDGKGKEYVQVHSERHDKHNCENSRRVQIGKSHTHIVGAFSMPGSGSGGGEELAEESHSHPPLDQQSFPPIEPPPAAARAISRKSIQRPHFLPPKAHDPTRQLSPGALRLLAELQKNRDDQAETIGSGRGGDDHGDESDGEEEAPFSWEGTDVFGGWAKNLDLTVGQKVDSVLGISTEFTFGAKTDTTINPLGFLGQLGGGESPAALGISGAFGGSVDFVIGSETYLVYGPHIDIHHGAKVEYNHGITLTLIPALAVAALEVTTVIVSALMPNDCDDIIAEFVGMGIVGIATALLIGFESKLGLAAMAEEAAEHVEATAKVAD